VVVLVSFLLVLAAAVTLVIGLLNSGLGLIYVSIGCSVAAGIVLALAVVRSRPERAAAPAVGSERLRALEEEEAPSVTVVPTRGGRRGAAAEADEEEEELEPATSDGEGVFPIADYDELKVGEIVSLLPELDDDELEQVRDREERGASRATVLNRIDQLLGVEPPPPPAKKAPAKKKAAAKKSTAKKTAAKKTTAKKSTAKKTAA